MDKSDQLTKSIGWSQYYDRDLNTCLTSWFGFVPASSSRPAAATCPRIPSEGRDDGWVMPSTAGKEHNIAFGITSWRVKSELTVCWEIVASRLFNLWVNIIIVDQCAAERAPCLKVWSTGSKFVDLFVKVCLNDIASDCQIENGDRYAWDCASGWVGNERTILDFEAHVHHEDIDTEVYLKMVTDRKIPVNYILFYYYFLLACYSRPS